MEFFKPVTLGIVQGLTEFLPVSSSGHLVILESIFHLKARLSLTVLMHSGSLLALLLFFAKDIGYILSSPFRRDKKNINLLIFIVIGTIPGALIGWLFNQKIESFFSSPLNVGVLLIVTGIILFLTGGVKDRKQEINKLTAFIIGLAQALAILPGISRSGATISTGIYLGVNREVSTRFSFLLSIPIIFGATLVELKHGFSSDASLSHLSVIAGIIASFAFSLFAIKFLLEFVKKHSLRPFSYYCFFVGIMTIVSTFTNLVAG
jgi:undecaprenyl-diphosphatase